MPPLPSPAPRILLLLLLAGLWSPGRAAASPAEPDLAESISCTFELKGQGDEARLEGRWTYHRRYLTERATALDVLRFGEGQHARLDRAEAFCRGRRLDGDRVGLMAVGARDAFFSEARVLTVAVPDDLDAGDEVEISYRERLDDLAYLPPYVVPNADRLEEFTLAFAHRQGVRIDFLFRFPHGPIPVEITRPDAEHTVLRVPPLDGAESLPYLANDGVRALILVRITEDGRDLVPTTPAAFAAWYDGLFTFPRELPAGTALPIDAALDAAPDDRARLGIVYRFVQENFRYIADVSTSHSLVPLPPAEILANRFGDCKDRVCLMRAIAAARGIPVDFVLVESQPGPPFAGAVNFALYDHMIGAWRGPAGTVYFDPTTRYVPFGELPEAQGGRAALLLDGTASRQVTLPAAGGPLDDEPAFAVAITAAVDSLDAGTAEITLRRWYRSAALAGLATERGNDLQNHLKFLTGSGLYKIGLDRFAVADPAADPLVLRAHADLSDFVVASPTRLYLPRSPLLAVGTDIRDRADDDLPLVFDSRADVDLRIHLDAPGCTATADSTRLGDGDLVTYAADLVPDGAGRVDAHYRLRRATAAFAGADRAAYLRFATGYLDHRTDMFILEKVAP